MVGLQDLLVLIEKKDIFRITVHVSEDILKELRRELRNKAKKGEFFVVIDSEDENTVPKISRFVIPKIDEDVCLDIEIDNSRQVITISKKNIKNCPKEVLIELLKKCSNKFE